MAVASTQAQTVWQQRLMQQLGSLGVPTPNARIVALVPLSGEPIGLADRSRRHPVPSPSIDSRYRANSYAFSSVVVLVVATYRLYSARNPRTHCLVLVASVL